jgi:hypothetical protein
MPIVKKNTKPVEIKTTVKQVSVEELNKMISDRAYYVWEEKGKPEGKDFEIWLQAEKDIRAKLRLKK